MPNKPQISSQNSSALISQPGIDPSIIKRLQEEYAQLTKLESVRSDKQDFGAIWVTRSEIKKLEDMARVQATSYAARARQIENEELEKRQKAELEVQKELSRKLAEETARKAREQLEIDAKALIKEESLFLCRRCYRGSIKVECSMCYGRGQGEPRYINETVASPCPNRHPTCRICGGTGVFGAIRRKMVYECQNCNGSGEISLSCPACKGGEILNGKVEAVDLPHELRDLVLELLQQKSE